MVHFCAQQRVSATESYGDLGRRKSVGKLGNKRTSGRLSMEMVIPEETHKFKGPFQGRMESLSLTVGKWQPCCAERRCRMREVEL